MGVGDWRLPSIRADRGANESWELAVTNMLSEVYEALTAAGAPEDKARKAEEALAKTDDRLGKI